MISGIDREAVLEKAREHWRRMRTSPKDIDLNKDDMQVLFNDAFTIYTTVKDDATKTAAAQLAVISKSLLEGNTVVVTPNPNDNSRILWQQNRPYALDKITLLPEEHIPALREWLISPIKDPDVRSHKARELRDQFRKPQTINLKIATPACA